MVPGTFVLARNPDPDSSLGYVVRLPIDGGIVLKVRDRWPTTARVFCHPAEAWPDGCEVLEEVEVRSCSRRGRAIDLHLDRPRENRSQFVWTAARAGRREMIFWQTAKTVQQHRPGQRVPTKRAGGAGSTLEVIVDTRERYPYRFAGRDVERLREALPVGDYGVRRDGELVAVVERKTLQDFCTSALDGTLGDRLRRLTAVPVRAVVVEERYGALLKVERVGPGRMLEAAAQLQVAHPTVPIVFADSRKLAEEWTLRFLANALARGPASG